MLNKFVKWYLDKIAVRRLVGEMSDWPWMGDIILDASLCYTNPNYKIEEPAVRWFKKDIVDEEIKKTIQLSISHKLKEMVKQKDPLIVNRLWIIDLVTEMAPWIVISKDPNKEENTSPFHPGFIGLSECKREAILKGMPDLIKEQYELEQNADEERVVSLAEYYLWFSYWKSSYLLRFANIIRSNIDKSTPDWFDRYLGVECAKTEEKFRESLGMPLPCNQMELLLEWYSIRNNLLKRIIDPCKDVKISERSNDFSA